MLFLPTALSDTTCMVRIINNLRHVIAISGLTKEEGGGGGMLILPSYSVTQISHRLQKKGKLERLVHIVPEKPATNDYILHCYLSLLYILFYRISQKDALCTTTIYLFAS